MPADRTNAINNFRKFCFELGEFENKIFFLKKLHKHPTNKFVKRNLMNRIGLLITNNLSSQFLIYYALHL